MIQKYEDTFKNDVLMNKKDNCMQQVNALF